MRVVKSDVNEKDEEVHNEEIVPEPTETKTLLIKNVNENDEDNYNIEREKN